MFKDRSQISCLPWMKWVLHKPIQTRAMATATKIIYSESAQWSDTSISFPVGDRENRGGHYKHHIARKVRSIFYPTLTPPILQTRPFSPGAVPSSAPIKMEACFPSINCCLRLPLRTVISCNSFLLNMFWSTCLCILCVKVRMWMHNRVHSLLSNYWQMYNGFPVILLP